MSRVSTFAANTLLLNQTLRTQQRVLDGQVAVSSEKKSQVYQGIATDSRRLINVENTRDLLQRYITDNDQMDVRLNIANTAVEGIRTELQKFKTLLLTFGQGGMKTEEAVDDIQADAFRALKSVESLLNTDVDGQYLFAGRRVSTEPVDLGLSTLAAFQAKYDGATVTYPTTRDAHLDRLSVDQNETTGVNSWLQFEELNGTSNLSRITGSSGEFAGLNAGSTIVVAGTGGVNDGTYTVSAVSSTTIDIVTEQFATQASSAGTVSFQDPSNINSTTTVSDSGLTFTNNNGTTADTVVYSNDALDALTVGKAFTIAGTANALNNSTFTVSAINTTTNTISITPKRFTDQGTGGAPYFTSSTNFTFADGGASADTVTAAAGTFRDASGTNLVAGVQLTFTGTASNNATYTIGSVSTDGSTVTLVSSDAVTAEGPVAGTATTTLAAGNITVTPFYNGDELTRTHRVDNNRDFTYDLDGVDPAFEKALRGMAVIAQGVYQTEGGLDQNTARVGQALALIEGALERTPSNTTPFGTTELSSNIEQIQIDLGFQRLLINDTNKINKDFIGFLDASIANMENTDQTEAITKLLDDQRALEASFQSFARIRQLSLTNFI